MVIYILIGFIFLIYLVRKSNTQDLIKQANITIEEQKNQLDEQIIKYKTSKIACLLLGLSLISLIVIASIRTTSIEVAFLNYFGTGINHEQIIIPLIWYITPFFVLVVRGIIIQVNIGDYVLKKYDLKEEEIDTKEALQAIKGLLYKKAPAKKTTKTDKIVTEEIEQLILDEDTNSLTPSTTNTTEATTEAITSAPQTENNNNINTIPQPVAPAAEAEQNNVNPFTV